MHFIDNWRHITMEPWALQVVQKRMLIEFWESPILTRTPRPSALPLDPTIRAALLHQVQELLQKQVIEPVVDPMSWGHYNHFFIVPKKEQGLWRTILDLSHLNRHYVTRVKFKMDTLEQFRELAEQGDFMMLLDLLDAYFHVLVHPSHWKYLRFSIQGTVYQYRVMPMGLSSSPRAFTHLSKVVKAWAQ